MVEQQMLKEQRITGNFDVVSGASNSIKQSMLPLAAKLQTAMQGPSSQRFYQIAEPAGGGLTALLKVVLDNGRIVDLKYDEIFADNPADIANEVWRKHYRQSKYDSVEYDEPSRIGFNVQMDALKVKVLATQNLLDISELPAIDATGNYASSGFTIAGNLIPQSQGGGNAAIKVYRSTGTIKEKQLLQFVAGQTSAA